MTAAMMERLLLQLPDGRDLDVIVGPGSSGAGLLFIGGAPTGAAAFPPAVAAAASRGLRFVTWARPGYSRSTRKPNVTVADFATDLDAVADRFGLQRLYVIGWSSGGPRALAAAALRPELVASAATIGSPAPDRKDGVDWEAQLGAERVAEQRDGPEHATRVEQSAAELEMTADATSASLRDFPSADRALADDRDVCEYLAESFREALATGIWGWHDDGRAEVRDWGFDFASIRVPVSIWQGVDDSLVPVAHGRWLADNTPGAQAHIIEGEGHLSIVANHLDDVLDELLQRSVAARVR
jgi:pimeloyl-ACP methyl ester carboxylesterase